MIGRNDLKIGISKRKWLCLIAGSFCTKYQTRFPKPHMTKMSSKSNINATVVAMLWELELDAKLQQGLPTVQVIIWSRSISEFVANSGSENVISSRLSGQENLLRCFVSVRSVAVWHGCKVNETVQAARADKISGLNRGRQHLCPGSLARHVAGADEDPWLVRGKRWLSQSHAVYLVWAS